MLRQAGCRGQAAAPPRLQGGHKLQGPSLKTCPRVLQPIRSSRTFGVTIPHSVKYSLIHVPNIQASFPSQVAGAHVGSHTLHEAGEGPGPDADTRCPHPSLYSLGLPCSRDAL